MSTKSTPVTSPARALRSSLRLSAPLVAAGTVLLAAPAMADLPEQWDVPADVQFMDFFMLIVGWPVVIGVVISAIIYVLNLRKPTNPALATVEGEWLGGPRTTKAADAEADANAGGASGTW